MAATRRSKRSRSGVPGDRPASPRRGMPVWLLASTIVAACVWAYSTSFGGALMNDDVDAIARNQNLRSLRPLNAAMTAPADTALAGRPIPTLTFAINYALAPAAARDAMVPDDTTDESLVHENLWGYHAVNLGTHAVAALLLLGVVRRTLLAPPLRDRFGRAAPPIAGATALRSIVRFDRLNQISPAAPGRSRPSSPARWAWRPRK